MMMYREMYLKYGTRKLKHFVMPRIISGEDFVFPRLSLLYIFKVSDIIQKIDKSLPILANENNSCLVYSSFKYNTTTLGNFHNSVTKPPEVVRVLQKNEKTFRFIKPGSKGMRIKNNQLFIVNYANLGVLYKYNNHPLNNYYKWYNAFSTLVSDINSGTIKNNRNLFINFDIPTNLVPLLKLNKYAGIPVNRIILERMINYKYLNILDLWKALDPKTRKDSLIGSINDEYMERITLLITMDNKIVMVKLKMILGLVKEYNIDTKLTNFSTIVARKILYIFFTRILLNNPAGLKEIESETNTQLDISGATKAFTQSDTSSESEVVDIDTELALTKDLIKTDSVDDGVDDDNIMDEINNLTSSVEEDPDINFESMSELKKAKNNLIGTAVKLNQMKEVGVISKNTHNKIEKLITKQHKTISAYAGDNITKILNTEDDDLTLSTEDLSINDTPSVLDKSSLVRTNEAVQSKYIKDIYKKDIVRVIYGMQNNEVVIENHEVEVEESILGAIESHTISIIGLDGTKSTLKILLPKINPDGTFVLSGNSYYLRKQKNDIPIKKINSDTVTLSSNYGTKLFITKNSYNKDNVSSMVRKHIVGMYSDDPKLKDLVLYNVMVAGVKLPYIYTTIACAVKSFKYDTTNYIFSYKIRDSILPKHLKISDIEDKKHILVGMDKDTPIVVDSNDILYAWVNKKYVARGSLLELLKLNKDDLLTTHAILKIYNIKAPVGLVLSYYLKLKKLLKLLKTEYTIVDASKRVKLKSNQYKITFSDHTIIVDKDYGYGDLILYGLTSINKILSNYTMATLNTKYTCVNVFTELGFSLLYINELKLLENMFVDPITKVILEEIKKPVTFIGLLVKSIELLVDNNYENPNNITSTYIKGYDRIAGMLYKELVNSMRTNTNASYFGKSKMTIDPYSILKKISNDNTTVLVDDLNPIAQIKQTEDIALTGEGGRSKESINFIARELDQTEIGIYSESSKDSGDVGINSYLSANPNIVNVRGMSEPTNEVEYSNVLSTTSMLMPFSVNDDVKRTNFATIQSTHTVPMNEMRAPYVRTGYESVLAVRASDKFVISAKDECVVIETTKTKVTVKYKDGKTDSYKLRSWTTKEESGSCYTHHIISAVSVKDKLRKDDTIAYDKLFFEPDIFDKRRVIFKQGTNVRVAFKEDMETYEDSSVISSKLNKRLGTVLTKVKTFILNGKDEVVDLVDVKDKVGLQTPLFSIADSTLSMMNGLDEKTKQILQDIKASTPKAKVNGIVTKITLFYNGDVETFSDSVQSLITKYDKISKSLNGHPGRVNSSYSVDGKPVMDGEIVIKIYISTNVGMGIGDKAIIGNQLKCTVGESYNYDIKTEDNKEVEMIFSTRSLSARIVNSPFLTGTTASVLRKVQENAVDIYFK